eukprot:4540360-Pyramimonas_sp.AAC.1
MKYEYRSSYSVLTDRSSVHPIDKPVLYLSICRPWHPVSRVHGMLTGFCEGKPNNAFSIEISRH